jgi:acetate kinase
VPVRVLCVNSGSSSLKVALYEDETPIASGAVEGIGLGERAAPVREDTCRGLEHLGIQIDHMRNARHDPVISAPGSACTVRIVPTDEDLMIARHIRALLARSAT